MKDVPDGEMDEGFWSCNIDNRGRLIRFLISLLCLLVTAWVWWAHENAFIASGLLAFSLVGFFEAFRGWCVLRAFGLRTPF